MFGKLLTRKYSAIAQAEEGPLAHPMAGKSVGKLFFTGKAGMFLLLLLASLTLNIFLLTPDGFKFSGTLIGFDTELSERSTLLSIVLTSRKCLET